MLKSGQIFAGRYRVERELGRGGLGVIYACEHIHTGQKVALKLLLADRERSPELQSAVREKFKLEQRVWSHAPSEHIVRVLDAGNLDGNDREAGEDAAGTLYMVMELLHGETLQQRVERMKLLAPAEVERVLQHIALGLDEAHGCRGPDGRPAPIVHRDLTPRNVFITTRPDGSVLAKLLDFGIAKHLVEGALVTQVLLGTRLYSAPEQLLGHAISPQTDVWALGLIAYYALTGREYGLLSGPQPVRPSRRCLEQGVGGILPGAFDRWFLRCVDPEPARRFASAGEAAAELASALAGAVALVPAAAAGEARPVALASTSLQPTARVASGVGGSVEAVSAASLAEPLRMQLPRVTVPLEPAALAKPVALPRRAAEGGASSEGPWQSRNPLPAPPVDTLRPAAAAARAEPHRSRWAALSLAALSLAALGAGGAFYVAWPTRESEPGTSELAVGPASPTQPQVAAPGLAADAGADAGVDRGGEGPGLSEATAAQTPPPIPPPAAPASAVIDTSVTGVSDGKGTGSKVAAPPSSGGARGTGVAPPKATEILW